MTVVQALAQLHTWLYVVMVVLIAERLRNLWLGHEGICVQCHGKGDHRPDCPLRDDD